MGTVFQPVVTMDGGLPPLPVLLVLCIALLNQDVRVQGVRILQHIDVLNQQPAASHRITGKSVNSFAEYELATSAHLRYFAEMEDVRTKNTTHQILGDSLI